MDEHISSYLKDNLSKYEDVKIIDMSDYDSIEQMHYYTKSSHKQIAHYIQRRLDTFIKENKLDVRLKVGKTQIDKRLINEDELSTYTPAEYEIQGSYVQILANKKFKPTEFYRVFIPSKSEYLCVSKQKDVNESIHKDIIADLETAGYFIDMKSHF